MKEKTKTKLALLSCGLGNVTRGFEVSTARWYEALKDQPDLEVQLYSGGKYPGATQCWNLDRTNLIKYLLRFTPGLDAKAKFEFAYGLEQVSWAFGFFPHLLQFKPDVIWTKEAPLAHLIDMFRFDLRLPYKIIFANGGGFVPDTYARFDFIQHLQNGSYNQALEWGIPASKMDVLCNLVPHVEINESKSQLRRSFGYTDKDWIVICVAAWNSHHKRIDYLINECASLNNPNLKLLLCGQPDIETTALQTLARNKLPQATQWLTLSPNDVRRALALSDVFVLPTIDECLGNVLIEAALAGLPIISHPHDGARYLTNDNQWLCDLSQPGNLAHRLEHFHKHPPNTDPLKQRALELTDSSKMVQDFQQMLEQVVQRSN
jgi:glycosyltransferase involved in cell wall biosynthesis